MHLAAMSQLDMPSNKLRIRKLSLLPYRWCSKQIKSHLIKSRVQAPAVMQLAANATVECAKPRVQHKMVVILVR